nr:putative ribonuclease H-like domain-containing protein [Tanacetum cinerariifolium]
MHAVKRIFRYVKGQPTLGLWYPKDSPLELIVYSDSDFAGASLDIKSTTEGCQFLYSRLISWQCKKQTIVANSTTDAEYIAASNCCEQTTSTLIEPNKALVKDAEAKKVDVHLYRSMIGSLMYLTASRPDITFVVYACARFQVTPKISHLHAMKKIFRYLKGQPKLGLWYHRDSPFDLEAYSDSDYAGASLDRKSTTGGCQFLSKRLISWKCKKQTIVANSTTKAEYVAAASCYGQVLWIQNQMLDYGFNLMNSKIYIDNESTICIVKNLVFHSKTKHIEIRHHFIRDSYEKKLIQMIKIHTDHNVADLLTKAFDVGILQTRVLDLENTKTTQGNEIASLKRRVKKLEKKNRSRTHKLKRLYNVSLTARVKSSRDEESLDEDASKYGRIEAINENKDITLVNAQALDVDKDMFDVNDLGGEEVFVTKQEVVKDVNENVVEQVVNAAQDSTNTTTITTKELTLPQALKALKNLKAKVKGIVIQE